MATLRDAQKQRTRQLLIEHGLELFASKGYQSVKIDDIAAAAGTTRATFYLHFASKAELMAQLIIDVGSILTTDDGPPLTTVIEVGHPDMVRDWLNRRFDQWQVIRPYMLAAHQAEASDPEVSSMLDKWFDDTVEAMRAGLEAAGRFDPETRRVRCMVAFGEFEFLSRQWFRRGWQEKRKVVLDTLTDSWCYLLTER